MVTGHLKLNFRKMSNIEFSYTFNNNNLNAASKHALHLDMSYTVGLRLGERKFKPWVSTGSIVFS